MTTLQLPLTPATNGLTLLEDPDARRRIAKQLLAVYDVMKSGEWMTLYDLAYIANCKEQSASARIRDLRKSPYGLTVERRLRWHGVFEYRVVLE